LIRDAIARRTHEDLSPLEDKEMPAELHEQVMVINDLMSRLEKTINAQQRFIADATHQIRTPIAVIRAQSELALRLENPEELKSEVTKIQHSSARLVRLSNQLLNLNRAEAGRLHALEREKVSVTDLLENVVADMVPFALQKDIEISLHNEAENIFIQGDRIFLREMLVNLIDNAIRYSPAESWIRVFAKTTVDQVNLSVVDCGPGIPTNELEKVLERFYRCAHVPSDGSGLGLAIAREIALLHHGAIKLSQAPGGVGLQADMVLPRAS
jgi:two-component system, OmpR family, sensor histidine kinase TctE